jgi:uncharacterized sulfatase
MSRWLLLLSLLLAAPAWAQPNILLVISDDQGWPHWGFMEPHVPIEHREALGLPHELDQSQLTPAIDAIAARGTMFPTAHNVAPVCRQSLGGLMSGRTIADTDYHRRWPIADADADGRIDLMPALLADAGYRTFGIGKNWRGDWAAQGMTDDGPPFRYAHDVTRKSNQPIFDFIADAESEGSPWFVWYAPYMPHVPHRSPEEYSDLFTDVRKGNDARYFRMIRWLDDNVGEIVNHLDTRGSLDDTLIIILADNGAKLPWSKGRMTDNGLRTPLVIAGPGVAAQAREELVSTLDILPTLLTVAGVDNPLPELITGADLSPILTGFDAPQWPSCLTGSRGKTAYARDQTHMLVSKPNGFLELYDLNADPNMRDKVRLRIDDIHAQPAAIRDRIMALMDTCEIE